MSVYLVTNDCVNRLAAYASMHELARVDRHNAAPTALMLWKENLRSVRSFYASSAEWPSEEELERQFVFDRRLLREPGSVGELVTEYAYQCTSLPAWKGGRAFSILQAIKQQIRRSNPRAG